MRRVLSDATPGSCLCCLHVLNANAAALASKRSALDLVPFLETLEPAIRELKHVTWNPVVLLQSICFLQTQVFRQSLVLTQQHELKQILLELGMLHAPFLLHIDIEAFKFLFFMAMNR